ncbi:MAG: LPS export ABC transporter periplasmic protein LptC [Gammaproteobacteria bacterium]|nr:LPS export ABC transporter periplasmic protein LptC [Gammaproteobacteria bacterium]
MQKTVLFLVALIGFFGFIYYLNEQANDDPLSDIQIIPNNIDYYLKNTQQSSFKDNGLLDFKLDTELVEHYKKEDNSLMQQPKMQVYRNQHWDIKAQQGLFKHKSEEVIFTSDVVIKKLDPNDYFKIIGEHFLFQVQQDLVISKTDVKVEGKDWELKAKTMTLNMDKDIHQFTTVKAQYRHDKKT